MNVLRNLHFYRKTPNDLTHATSSGGAISLVALLTMMFLFVSQLQMYFTLNVNTQVMMDPSAGPEDKISIDFDITVAKVPCRLLSVDLFDVLGTARLNMTEDPEHKFRVAKTSVITNSDMMYIPGAKQKVADGPLPREVFARHHTKNEAMKEIEKFPVSQHENWKENWDEEVYSKTLTTQNFQEIVSKYEFVMVNYHAPWCPWCARLKPVWEHAAGLIEKTTMDYGEEQGAGFHGFEDRNQAMYDWEEYNSQHHEEAMTLQDFLNVKRKEKGLGPMPEEGRRRVLLAKVDCTQEQLLCRQQRIMGFPTVRVYTPKEGQPLVSFREYDGDRTAQSFLAYVHEQMPEVGGFTDEDAEYEELRRSQESEMSPEMQKRVVENGDSHGCNVVGTVTVNKVPGTLMITAHSNYKSLALENLNMSHIIHHLLYRPTDEPTLRNLESERYEDQVSNQDNALSYGTYARQLMRSHAAEIKERLSGAETPAVLPFLFPLDQTRHTAKQPRQVLSHYIKVVHTFVTPVRSETTELYQHQVHSSTDVVLPEGGQPMLNFTYDMSPLSYGITGEYKPTADFLTSTCAIIGGVFTVIGLFDSVIYNSATSIVGFLNAK